MVILKNDTLTAEISENGAELRKLTLNGENRLWCGDPAVWAGIAPVIFPICGGLKDDKFTYKGKEYQLNKHGFARFCKFDIEMQTDHSAAFLLKSNTDTLKQFPWEFELHITYTLRGNSIQIEYKVKNISSDTMYMSIGSHEGYACPEGIEDYDIIFEKAETLSSYDLDGNLLSHHTTPIIKDTDTLPLYYKYFKIDALVFKDLRSRSATLRNRKTGKVLTVDFPDCDYLVLWSKPDAGYICIEPWSGIQPMVDSGYDITKKEGINAVEPGAVFKSVHTMRF